jgi:predicted SAM-dependent methyltransferase
LGGRDVGGGGGRGRGKMTLTQIIDILNTKEKNRISVEFPPRSGKFKSYNKDIIEKLKSETSLCRSRLAKFCEGNGLDLGYGGDPIVPEAITLDLPEPYFSPSWLQENPAPQNLKGDARSLYWFNDNCLDYVYSAHLLEDFEAKEIPDILREWLRVIKPNGYLVLYLPDQKRYEEYCENKGVNPNPNHKIPMFSLNYLLRVMGAEGISRSIYIVHSQEECDDYSFEVVFQKRGEEE